MQENQPRISRVTIGRLHNLGNYEHIRYELTVEVPEGQDPEIVIFNTEQALNRIGGKSPVSEYDLKAAREILQKPASDLSQWDAQNLDTYRKRIERHEAWEKSRETARRALSHLGATAIYTDAKDNWDEQN